MGQSKFDKHYYFGKVYKNYDTFLNFKKLAKDLIKQYSFNSFLDIGCGCGNFTKEIKRQLEKKYKRQCNVRGVDLSEYAVKKANVSFVSVADCRQLPFPDSSFDLVHILGTFAYLESKKDVLEAIKEAYRVCRKKIVFEDVYNIPEKSSDDYDPYRIQFLNQNEWRKLWLEVLKRGDKIEFNKEEIIISKS